MQRKTYPSVVFFCHCKGYSLGHSSSCLPLFCGRFCALISWQRPPLGGGLESGKVAGEVEAVGKRPQLGSRISLTNFSLSRSTLLLLLPVTLAFMHACFFLPFPIISPFLAYGFGQQEIADIRLGWHVFMLLCCYFMLHAGAGNAIEKCIFSRHGIFALLFGKNCWQFRICFCS